jgi:hypothetical protein
MNDESLSEIVQTALSAALNPNGDVIVTRWVLAVERYAADGKGLAFLCHPDMQPWEVIGMAEMASELARIDVQNQVVDDLYADDDDDD